METADKLIILRVKHAFSVLPIKKKHCQTNKPNYNQSIQKEKCYI